LRKFKPPIQDFLATVLIFKLHIFSLDGLVAFDSSQSEKVTNTRIVNLRVTTKWMRFTQGRNEIRWHPGQEARLASPVRTWGLPEGNLLYYRKYFWNCWDFRRPQQTFGPPAVIRRSHDDLTPGELCPPYPPSLRPWFYVKYFAHVCEIFTAVVSELQRGPHVVL